MKKLSVATLLAWGVFGFYTARAVYPQEVNNISWFAPSATTLYTKCAPSVVKFEAFGKDAEGNIKHWLGSGVVIAPDLIVTCRHVAMAEKLSVEVSGCKRDINVLEDAVFLMESDIAFVHVKNLGLPAIKLETNPVAKGSLCYSLGFSLGIEKLLAFGTYNGILSTELMGDIAMYSAPISPGNSGGALLTEDGTLLGITSASMVQGQNFNLAVPVSTINKYLPAIKASFHLK